MAESVPYFYEQVEQRDGANKRIEVDAAKNSLSEKRRIFRHNGAKKQFLSIINDSSSFPSTFKNIERDLKKSKEGHKQIKEALSHKKEQKRKFRRNTEKLIAQIFAMREEIEKKRLNSARLSSEWEALQAKHQNTIFSDGNASKYKISELIDDVSMKQIIANQEQTLQQLMTQSSEELALKQKENALNKEFAQKSERLNKESQTLVDVLCIQRQENALSDQLLSLKRSIESMQRLLSIKQIKIDSNELLIEFGSENGQIYAIKLKLIPFECDGKLQSYSIQSVEVTNRNTKYSEIVDYVLAKYQSQSEQSLLVNIPMAAIKRIVIEICIILKKLPMRYRDIRELAQIYGAESNKKQEMLPWLEESAQLVFKFEFKQKIKRQKGSDDDDDEKVDVVEVTMDIPLVIVVSWNYPQMDVVRDREVINVEHFNCSLRERDHRLDVEGIEEKWNKVLREVVDGIKGKFQNDIVSFVNFIQHRLQKHNETEML